MRHLTFGVILCALGGLASPVAAQSNWAEQLGYPAGKRVVILHANDLGITYECNRPAQAALTEGVLNSASVVTSGPWFAEACQWAKANPGCDLGVSLSFVSPSPAIKWGPAAPRHEVDSLTTLDGYFAPSLARFHLRAEAEEVRREAAAQIRRARANGLQPTHIHPHLGAMLTRPDLLRVYLELAEEFWIPAVMVDFTPELVARFEEAGFPLNQEMLDAVAEYKLPKIDDIKSVPDAESYEEKKKQFFALFQELKPGITQIFVEASDDSPGMRRASESWQKRAWEAQLLDDREVKDFLKKQDVVFTNWREIMNRFEAMQSGTEE